MSEELHLWYQKQFKLTKYRQIDCVEAVFALSSRRGHLIQTFWNGCNQNRHKKQQKVFELIFEIISKNVPGLEHFYHNIRKQFEIGSKNPKMIFSKFCHFSKKFWDKSTSKSIENFNYGPPVPHKILWK